MKALFVAVGLALVAAVSAQLPPVYTFAHADYGCVWTATVDVKSLFQHVKYKLWVNKNETRLTKMNHNDVVLEDEIIRVDLPKNWIINPFNPLDFVFYYMSWKYSAEDGCRLRNEEYECNAYDEDPVKAIIVGQLSRSTYRLFEPVVVPLYNFTNYTKGDFDEKTYDVYYFEDMNDLAYYVDGDRYVVAIVTDADIESDRTEYRLTYDHRAAPEDFVFDKKKVYNCSDQQIFTEPAVNPLIMCAASATKVALAVVAASLLSAFLALF